MDREDQQHILKQLTGLTSLAAAVALEVTKSPFKALQLLELGRSITNGQLLDYRSDISHLLEEHPPLAKAFDSLRLELDSPSPTIDQFSGLSNDKRIQMQQTTIRQRNRVAKDLDDILEQIRQKPGFKNFLRAESKEYLLSAAYEGPVVVLNVTELRSDAILVTSEQITSISLPQLSHDVVDTYFGSYKEIKRILVNRPTEMDKAFHEASDRPIATTDHDEIKRVIVKAAQALSAAGYTTNDNEEKRILLDWLWKAAVQPVLCELGFYPKVVDPLPRIWWIGVGLMAQAPIHAAAKFKKGYPTMTTLQYCIPSYTSTIRALQYSRSRQTQHNASMKSMLIVTMPTTPGESSLDVDKEADDVRNCTGDYSTVQILRRPTAKQILEILPASSIVHLDRKSTRLNSSHVD